MAGLASRLTVPVLCLIFVVAFQISINDLSFESRAMPQVVIILLGLACLYSIVRDGVLWRAGGATEAVSGNPLLEKSSLRTGAVILVTAVYIYVLDIVGFYPATAAFLGLCYVIIGRFSLTVVPYVLGALAVIYALFELGLTVLLPDA